MVRTFHDAHKEAFNGVKHWFDVCNMATLICVITLKYIYYIVTTVRCPYYVLPPYLNACASVHSNCCSRRFSRTHSIFTFDYASSLTIPHLAKFVKINLFSCHFNVKNLRALKNKSPYSGSRVFRCKCIIKYSLTFYLELPNAATLSSLMMNWFNFTIVKKISRSEYESRQ